MFALDHDIQNRDEANLKKYCSIEAFAKEQGVDFYPAGSGIGHQIMVERGYVVPGSFVVASDSHSNMYGALGAIGTPIVRTDAAAVWATGEFWWQIPRSIQVVLEGKLRPGVSGKDVIISLCGLYNHDEALNAAVEFSGRGVASLSMDARFSISNMSTEWGPLVGWFPVDEVTIAYLRDVHLRLARLGIERFTKEDIESWTKAPPRRGSRCFLCGTHHARPRRSNAPCLGTRHRAGDAIPRGGGEKESCHPEGLPDFLRKFASRRPGGRSPRVARKKSCAGSEVLLGSGKRVGAARSRETRRLADAARRGRKSAAAGMRAVHRARAWACWRRARSEFQPRTAISKAAWDRAMPSAIWRVRKSSRHRRSQDTSRGHIRLPIPRRHAASPNSPETEKDLPKKWRFYPASRNA